jgi:hypothetical protein
MEKSGVITYRNCCKIGRYLFGWFQIRLNW